MPQSISIRKSPGKPGEVYHSLQSKAVPKPTPRNNQLLIRLEAAALNHRDLFIRRNLYPGVAFDVPLFCDACGTVQAAGTQELERKWIGKRVVLAPGSGWDTDPLGPENSYAIRGGTSSGPEGVLQNWILVDTSEIEEAPSHLTTEEAAALPLTGLTAWRALVTKSSNAVAGRNILITGAGGGVALMATLFAVKLGMNVYVNAGSNERISEAVRLGAKGGVLFADPDWPTKLKTLLPKERPVLDTIIDGAGADIVNKTMRLLKHGGTIVTYGMTTGPSVSFPMGAVMRNIQYHGSTSGSRAEFGEMVRFVDKHKIRPVISEVIYGLDDLDALDVLFQTMQEGKQFGKLVVSITGEQGSLRSKI